MLYIVLVLFWESNWDILLTLVKGGASFTHDSKSSVAVLNHMYVEGWGWDPHARLDALLVMLFLGVAYKENTNFHWPAPIINRYENISIAYVYSIVCMCITCIYI